MVFSLIVEAPGHQFTNYYREGELDNCKERLFDFKLCMAAKMTSDEDTAKEQMKQVSYHQSKKWALTQEIWEYKTPPRWG
mmetsp:Transcript_26102/g.33759  ORF Transcript_26102/g.33759 Transcript_26102/m.33759 type:complete len:80 (+) Transcript_26102:318-557(+)